MMKKINSYILEKLRINKDSKNSIDDEDIVLKDFIIHYLDNNYSLKYEKHYDLIFRVDEKNVKHIDIKFSNDIENKIIGNVNKVDLCQKIEKELSFDYYWSIDLKSKTISLSNTFI